MFRSASWLPVLLTLVCTAVYAGVARAEIMVPLPIVELPVSDSPQNVSYDVPVVITSPDTAFDSFGYGIRFRVVPQGGAVGSVIITGGGAAAGNPAFSTGDISVTTQAGGLEAFAQGFNTTAQTVSDGSGLFSFDLLIAADTEGSFMLEFFDAPGEPTSLFNSIGGTVAGVGFVDGQVVVTPEPASLALMAMGCVMLGMRHRKRAA